MARVLLVEDEEPLRILVSRWLKNELHNVDTCTNGIEAMKLLSEDHFDVILLDIMLPGMTGFEVCRRFREAGGTTPILMLTAKRTLNDKEIGLDSGADDYLTKPFKLRELAARVRALSRRQPSLTPNVLKVGDLVLDTGTNKVWRGDAEIKLVAKEFSLLQVLMRHSEQVVKSDLLVKSVWGLNSNVSPETIRSYIRLLRQKIDRPGEASLIETVHGVGYRLGSPDEQ